MYRLRRARPQAGVNPTNWAAAVAEAGRPGRVTSHRTCQRVWVPKTSSADRWNRGEAIHRWEISRGAAAEDAQGESKEAKIGLVGPKRAASQWKTAVAAGAKGGRVQAARV